MKRNNKSTLGALLVGGVLMITALIATAGDFPVVDTGQELFFNASAEISAPSAGAAFFGQDAQYDGNAPDFFLSADQLSAEATASCLTWQRVPDTNLDGILEPGDKLSWWDALDQPAVLNAAHFGGFNDWRLPNIKELYSLIDFRGIDPSGYQGSTEGLVPFMDTNVFEFIYGDENIGERIIDSQYWTTSEYVSTTMNGDHTVFGVNFADGRIKGYPTTMMGQDKTAFVLCVRGNTNYSVNDFQDNGDGTITDQATGLMWMQGDSADALNWQDALSYAENLTLAEHDDWRLPNAKELQTLVDYTRSPSTHNSAAIDPMFACSTIIDEGGANNFPYYWTGTTHQNWSQEPGSQAIYVAFGEALGWMQTPFPPYTYNLMDVHGAGAQRSDPKTGDPADWPYGHGPQGDTIRIYNHVRCVRDAVENSGTENPIPSLETGLRMENFPNPFNPSTEIVFYVPQGGHFRVDVFNAAGSHVCDLLNEDVPAGETRINWSAVDQSGRPVPSGLYFVRLCGSHGNLVSKMLLAK